MITNLTIKNYTLIDTLEIDFQRGFSVITGGCRKEHHTRSTLSTAWK